MKWFHVWNWLLSYDPLKILNILAISLSDNIIFKNFFAILLDNNYIFHVHTFVDKTKIIVKLFEFIF